MLTFLFFFLGSTLTSSILPYSMPNSTLCTISTLPCPTVRSPRPMFTKVSHLVGCCLCYPSLYLPRRCQAASQKQWQSTETEGSVDTFGCFGGVILLRRSLAAQPNADAGGQRHTLRPNSYQSNQIEFLPNPRPATPVFIMTAVEVEIKQEADEKIAVSALGNGFQSMPPPPPPQAQSEGPAPDIFSSGSNSNIPPFSQHNTQHIAEPQLPEAFPHPNRLAENYNYNPFDGQNVQQWMQQQQQQQQQPESPASSATMASQPSTPLQPGPSEPHRRTPSIPTHAQHVAQPPPGKVAIPRQSLPEPPGVVHAGGPIGQTRVLPARAKPGRKAIQSSNPVDKASKRQAQNRQSQRKHREKKKDKEEDQKWAVSYGNQTLKGVVAALNNERAAHTKVEAENQRLREQVAMLQGQSLPRVDSMQVEHNAMVEFPAPYQQPGYGPHAPGPTQAPQTSNAPMVAPRQPPRYGPYGKTQVAHSTPPEYNAYETDFTNVGRAVSQTTHSSELGPSGLSADDRCGFCSDASYCVCKQNDAAEPETQPGNCEKCIADPERAYACRQLAASAQYPGFRPLSSDDMNNNDNNASVTSAAPSPSMVRSDSHFGRISCEQLMDRARNAGQRFPSVAELFGNQIHAYPASNGRYEVEEHEAAQALQSLSTYSPKLERNKS